MIFDVAVIGGGIVGLATAYRLAERYPARRVVMLEKESDVALHQSGRNSGVIHSGIYYRPGSLKARTCIAGARALRAFLDREGITYRDCGKVIVATSPDEIPRLRDLLDRGRSHGLRCAAMSAKELRDVEPHVRSIEAIRVPEAGVVDYRQVCARLSDRLRERGHMIVFHAWVNAMRETTDTVVIGSTADEYQAKQVVNCAGLHSDRVTALLRDPPARIIPFRGEYYVLRRPVADLCRALVYPVPDPAFPFLGIHFTRSVDDVVHCGPNAVLAFSREGYSRTSFNLRDVVSSIAYRGTWSLAARYWRTGMAEAWRSLNKRAFVGAAQRLIPEVRVEDFESSPSGVRAQAVSNNGQLLDDFVLDRSRRVINVINAPSPAATASFGIADAIVDMLAT